MGADRKTGRAHLATGVTVPYLEQGDPRAPAVVLLHAWVESSACFDRLLQAVPQTLRVFAMDQRGHGDADKPANGYALVNFADDIEAFMDAVGLQSAVLLGSSSGGYVAQQVAVQVPHRVDGLVLVGAPRSLQGRPAFADDVDRLTDPVDPSWVEESLTWFPRYHNVPGWYIKDRIRDGLSVPAHVWIAGLTGLTTAVPPSESGTITAPTLIIWGERDELLPLQDGYLLAAAIPGSRLIVYDDTGHLVLWEQPERVATDLTGFVAGLSTSGQSSTPIS
ncbi:MAG TPA: alpha/beta hydrolase [Propionibacteriaceae bacterium]|nr:alpha/beta hydrolase [Propionibacteriaceae bacterium]